MMPRRPTKKKRPIDATLRNVRASHTRDAALLKRISRLEKQMAKVMAALRIR